MGFGTLPALARTGAAPNASSKNVPNMVLTMVFFMLFSLWLSGFDFPSAKHSLCLPPGEDKMGIFQSSKVAKRPLG